MGSLTYTALRKLETTGYAKSATDISAAASDDSFNSVSTDLTGLSDNQWILVSGFIVNPVNNGWFQANGNSALHKITQDTTSSLVNESAGAQITVVGYKRGLNQVYSLDFDLELGDRGRSVDRVSNRAKGGGAAEVIHFSSDDLLQVRTGRIAEALMPQWREILASVESGETMIFDRYGTAASPIEPVTVQFDSESYQEVREGTAYPGFYRLNFNLRMV